MNEVKRPRKPLLFYYCLVLILLLGYAGYFLRYQTRIFELRREIAAVEQTLRKERWK